jgi:hypothetical protein
LISRNPWTDGQAEGLAHGGELRPWQAEGKSIFLPIDRAGLEHFSWIHSREKAQKAQRIEVFTRVDGYGIT